MDADVNINNDKSYAEVMNLDLSAYGITKEIELRHRPLICALDAPDFQISTIPEDDWFKTCKDDPDAILWMGNDKCNDTGRF